VIALRGLVNERSEFLMTTLPIVSLDATSSRPLVFAHFADGGGWTTQLVLINPSNSPQAGNVQFLSTDGTPAVVVVDGQSNNSFAYSIPANSSVRLKTSNPPGTTQAGSVVVTPAGTSTAPSGLVIFSFNNGVYTVSEAGVQASTLTKSVRISAEASDIGLPVMTGIALANPSSNPIDVQFELTTPEGGPTGLTGFLTIPAKGQIAQFLNQIPGFTGLPEPFSGILRISTDSAAGIAVTGLRGRTNERGDFLITTTPPVDQNAPASNTETTFPHIADGGGFTTEFILFSGGPGQTPSGVVRFFDQGGQPLDLNVGTQADLAVTQTGPPSCNAANNQCNSLTFQITIKNNGPGAARGVRVTDFLPVDPTSGLTAATVGQITGTGTTCSQSSGAIVCDIGDLPSGGARTISIAENIMSSAQGRIVTNSVRANSDSLDLNSANSVASLDVSVLPQAQADLQIGSFGIFPSPGSVGSNVFFFIGITNQGPSTATQVRVTNTLSGSANLVFSPTGSTPGCTQTGPKLVT